MANFQPIAEVEADLVWNKFYALFKFNPGPTVFPAIHSGQPQIKLDISELFNDVRLIKELEVAAHSVFIRISEPGERLYALDWQHQCYDFDPRKPFERDEYNDWIVPVFPNGDYYIFLKKDFSNVWFGHPWEQTVTLIGSSIIDHWKAIGFVLPFSSDTQSSAH
jgi:hypothetical protein